MPHVTIEYSANVADHHDIDALVEVVHRSVLDQGFASADALRTRAVARTQYRVGTGDPQFAFVALHLRVGPGRDPATKQALLAELLDVAEAQLDADYPNGTPLAIMWSIELGEIDPEMRLNRNRVREQLHQPPTEHA